MNFRMLFVFVWVLLTPNVSNGSPVEVTEKNVSVVEELPDFSEGIPPLTDPENVAIIESLKEEIDESLQPDYLTEVEEEKELINVLEALQGFVVPVVEGTEAEEMTESNEEPLEEVDEIEGSGGDQTEVDSEPEVEITLLKPVPGSEETVFNNEHGSLEEVALPEANRTFALTDNTQDKELPDEPPSGQCPIIDVKPSEECLNTKSKCWTPGFQDVDCVGLGEICCFDGCANYCLDEINCVKRIVNETQEKEQEEEVCVDVEKEVCKDIVVEKCVEECDMTTETITIVEPVEECRIEQEEVCDPQTVMICHDEDVPIIQDMEKCKNTTETTCEDINIPPVCEVEYSSKCNTIVEKIPRVILREVCRNVPQPPKCEEVTKNLCKNESVPITITEAVESCSNITKEVCEDIVMDEEKEVCTDIPNEVCKYVDVPKSGLKKVKKCSKKVYNKCRTMHKEVCSGSRYDDPYFPYECKKVPQTVCRKVPKNICRYETVIYNSFTPKRECSVEYKKDCKTITVPKTERKCQNETEPSCSVAYVNKVESSIKEICENVEHEECRDVPPKKECTMLLETVIDEEEKEVCMDVPEETCGEPTVENVCTNSTKEVCEVESVLSTETRKVCEDVEKSVCHFEDKEICETVDKEVEKDIPKEVCQDVCVDEPKQECETYLEKECEIVLIPVSVVVSVEVCD